MSTMSTVRTVRTVCAMVVFESMILIFVGLMIAGTIVMMFVVGAMRTVSRRMAMKLTVLTATYTGSIFGIRVFGITVRQRQLS